MGAVPGALTACIACTLLQFTFNEVAVARVKYVSSRMENLPFSNPSIEEQRLSSADSHNTNTSIFSKDRLLGLFGFQKVTDDEYLTSLKKERDVYMRKIKELEAELGDSSESSKSNSFG